MAKIYITITGSNHYYGNDLFTPGMKIKLSKEPDNEYDNEAIKATVKGLGKVGYVANSTYTVLGECYSAGRLYDKIGDTAKAKVVTVTPRGIVCKVTKKTLLGYEEPYDGVLVKDDSIMASIESSVDAVVTDSTL